MAKPINLLNPEGAEGRAEIPPVESAGKVVAGKVEKALQRGEAEVAGLKMNDPKQAYENYKFAFDYLKNNLGISMEDVYFKQFSGDVVGESTSAGIEIDPILLMHPAMRLVYAIAHESGHSRGKVDNEGLVEAYVKYVKGIDLMGDDLVKTERYDTAEKNFYEFVERVSDGAEIKATVEKIYELYYSQKYEEIYELYDEKYLKGLPEDERVEAFDFFFETFPEFTYDWEGQTSLMRPEEMDEAEEL
ncbi:MAG: hypothetical protein ABIH78_03090 [Candidatus Peregrinibacteria bacterium]